MATMPKISAFARRVGEEFQPEKIILFGSYARGSATPDSDVDMLVIIPFEGKPWRTTSLIREKVRPPFPLDLLARTPARIRDRLSLGDGFIRGITERGRIRYES